LFQFFIFLRWEFISLGGGGWLPFEQDLCKQIKRAACQAISFLTIEQVRNEYGEVTPNKIKSFRAPVAIKVNVCVCVFVGRGIPQ